MLISKSAIPSFIKTAEEIVTAMIKVREVFTVHNLCNMPFKSVIKINDRNIKPDQTHFVFIDETCFKVQREKVLI